MRNLVFKGGAISVLLMMLLGGCMSISRTVYDGSPRFQSIAIGNEGRGVVDKVSIQYGKHPLIGGPAMARYLPKHGVFGYISLEAPIPDHTEVYWVTEDRVVHEVLVPTRSLVPNFAVFYGFKFTFKDEYVEVYVTDKIPTPGPYLDTKETKVYTSPLKAPRNIQPLDPGLCSYLESSVNSIGGCQHSY